VEKPIDTNPRWGQARRLAFIDLRLQYDGRINRRDLQEFFSISIPQASADIETYRRQAPDNIVYDPSRRQYLAGRQFTPCYGSPDAMAYLDELYRIERGLMPRSDSFVGFVPPTGVVATPARAISGTEVAILIEAIEANDALEIVYQSMSSKAPVTRTISPHALGFDGLRWHVRAWCHQRLAFRDFAIGRLSVVGSKPDTPKIDPTMDDGWQTFVDIILVPHPALSRSQRITVTRDYGMTNDRLALPCRKAMLFYTLRHLNLHAASIADDPATQHVIVENRQEVDAWMFEDRALSPAP